MKGKAFPWFALRCSLPFLAGFKRQPATPRLIPLLTLFFFQKCELDEFLSPNFDFNCKMTDYDIGLNIYL